ncbi:MAG: FAD-dependent oxidoreductase [Betaproteobacteria bacterium]|nr:FAD-dependent oxidoreductase [Betaproteobacteria bacterium]
MIGAGAAGLAAARALADAGRSVAVLEARERIGGRCWTRRLPGVAAPVELGAEFIHGRPRATLDLMARVGVPGVDSSETQRLLDRGRLREVDAFDAAQKAMSRPPSRDVSFAEFLARKKLPALTKRLATMMVQGFDAADPRLVSARDIAAEWSEAFETAEMRPQGGYRPLLDFLAQGLDVRLGSPVREIRWRRGEVEVNGLRASKAIVTLPLGVLQAGSVRFSPHLRKEEPLTALASGPVIRVAMAFREPFWEKRFGDVAFFHAPQSPFPTMWTPLPMRVPLLTAWAGGPKASAMTGSSRRDLVDLALRSVRTVFGRDPKITAALVQDWAADPFARGGYSYVKVGGERARRALARPIDRTLYFAGEATNTEGEAGTVGGALQTGLRAAEECL